jgi:hypothetical protein
MDELSYLEPIEGAIPAWDKWLFRLSMVVLTAPIGFVLVILIRALNFWVLNGELPIPMQDDPKDLHTLVDILGRWYTSYFGPVALYLAIPAPLLCVIQLVLGEKRWVWPIGTFAAALGIMVGFMHMDPWHLFSWWMD